MSKRKKARDYYAVMWNELYGWGRIACRYAVFKSERARYRFCMKLMRSPDFVGIVQLTNL